MKQTFNAETAENLCGFSVCSVTSVVVFKMTLLFRADRGFGNQQYIPRAV